MPRSFKQMLAERQLVRVFALGRVVHPILIEMFGLAGGYHGFWLDGEHTNLTNEQMVTAALAARANDFDSFARIPPTGYWQVTQCLETGLGGVMAAQIHSADHAEEFVKWTKFTPRGTRGMNVGGRDGDYSHKPPAQFIEQTNREQFVAIQIETLGALEEADAIAAIDGVDLLFIGPADLSLCLGVVGEFHHDKLWEAIDRVATACRNHGKTWGAVTPDPKFADRAIENGCLMPTFGNDVLTLRRGVDSLKNAFTRHFDV
jgi:2-dehydro-3-deoxyglucarate aldolase/4-hydroxy-2-oxoheptanedioate aldolase